MNKKIIKKQPTEQNPIIINNYPYGFKRTQIKYWVESIKGKGERFVSQTLNPQTQLWNKPKKSTYSSIIILYKNEKDHIKGYYYSRNTSKEDYQRFINFIGDLELNELQKEELRISRAYIKTYANVTFKIEATANFSEEEQKKRDLKQKENENSIKKAISYNYNKDKGDLNLE